MLHQLSTEGSAFNSVVYLQYIPSFLEQWAGGSIKEVVGGG